MGSIAKFRKRQMGYLAAAVMAMAYMPTALALPTGEHNISKTDGVDDLTVTRPKNNYMKVELDCSKAAVDWKSFNIANIGKRDTMFRRNISKHLQRLNI